MNPLQVRSYKQKENPPIKQDLSGIQKWSHALYFNYTFTVLVHRTRLHTSIWSNRTKGIEPSNARRMAKPIVALWGSNKTFKIFYLCIYMYSNK